MACKAAEIASDDLRRNIEHQIRRRKRAAHEAGQRYRWVEVGPTEVTEGVDGAHQRGADGDGRKRRGRMGGGGDGEGEQGCAHQFAHALAGDLGSEKRGQGAFHRLSGGGEGRTRTRRWRRKATAKLTNGAVGEFPFW
eukprot:1345842-Prymnesium_polylepis.2